MTNRLIPLALTAASLAFVPLPAQAEPLLGLNPTTISDVAERVTPAVVNITTRRTRQKTSAGDHPMLREFFGPGRRRQLPPEMGAGSGVVISADGYVITNNHVIDGADEIKVTFSDKRELEAKLIGADKPSDIALLKVKAKKLPFLGFGDSSKLRLGEIVLAVGNPFGVGQTVTMGIVSAKGRANVGIVDYEDFIQTDASINPGNSGGALVNLKGELVGVNTAILSRSGGAQGIGFAVPSNMVKPIREQIRNYGRVRRGWLGVAIQNLTPDLAHSLSLDGVRGVLVSDVMEKGPAARGKLKAGDVIVSVNNKPTQSAAQLRNHIALTAPGSKAALGVLRDGKKKTLSIKLDEKKNDEEVAAAPAKTERILSGLSVTDLDSEVRQRLRIPRRVRGAVVREVAPNSAAERSGLEVGDVITQANRRPIKNSKDFQRAIKKGTKELLLRVYKRGLYTFVVLRR